MPRHQNLRVELRYLAGKELILKKVDVFEKFATLSHSLNKVSAVN